MKRHKPDILFLLAIIVGIGVILTMRVQAGATQTAKEAVSSDIAVAQTPLKNKKTN